jgi:hypothetical protein
MIQKKRRRQLRKRWNLRDK